MVVDNRIRICGIHFKYQGMNNKQTVMLIIGIN
jgi:hypothetical protein